MDSMSDHYVNCEVEFKARTQNAVLVAQYAEEIWIPRSLVSYSCDKEIENLKRGDEFTLKVREWIATQEGLEF